MKKKESLLIGVLVLAGLAFAKPVGAATRATYTDGPLSTATLASAPSPSPVPPASIIKEARKIKQRAKKKRDWEL